MSRLILTVLISLYALVGNAQLKGDGYYRFQNFGSKRYIYVSDNRGKVNIGATSADLRAILLWSDIDRSYIDPATVVYVTNVGGGEYRFHSQGTNSYTIVGYDLRIKENTTGAFAGTGTYKAGQSKGGMAQYLCDEQTDLYDDLGVMATATKDHKDPIVYRKFTNWYIKPVDTADNYFGLAPTVHVGNDYYAPFYAEFPFNFASSGMVAYYIKKVDRGMAVMEEIKGTVPAATPVFVKCSSNVPSNNKLKLLTGGPSAPSNNHLKGVYFCYTFRGNHYNVTPYNPETMRMLMVSDEGKLVFGKANIKDVPANVAFLKVQPGSPDEIAVVTQKQYDDMIAAGIDEIVGMNQQDERIFTISGILVGEGADDLKSLPAGVYVSGGKKFVLK